METNKEEFLAPDMSFDPSKEDEFLANICQGGRVTVPLAYREKLSLKQGTRVRIKIRNDEP
uniref:SpoVT-AbrB domain-containing protein n=1 Tax=viral metagenome TaxID=1070528 RepID=A0A6M3LWS5_9ZZZZ